MPGALAPRTCLNALLISILCFLYERHVSGIGEISKIFLPLQHPVKVHHMVISLKLSFSLHLSIRNTQLKI